MRRLLIFSLVVLLITLIAAPALGGGSLQEAASPSSEPITSDQPTARLSPDPITTEEPVPAQQVVDLEETSPTQTQADPVLVGGAVLFVLLLTGGLFRLLKRRHHETAEPEKFLINR